MLNLWLCIIAIVVSIVLGWKFKMNTGIIAMCFAFVIGVFFMDMSVSTIISYWPTTIVFYLVSIALFFSYGTQNGTMDVLGHKLLYALNGNAKLIPIVIFLVCAIVGGLGAGASTPAIVGPFLFLIGLTAGVHPALIAICIAFGNTAGSNNIYTGYGGLISKSLIEEAGYGELTTKIANLVYLNSVIAFVLASAVFYFIYKGFKAKRVEVQKAEKFNPIQRKTMTVIIIAFVVMIVPALLNTWFSNPVISKIAAFCQPQTIMFLGSLVCCIMKLGNEKEVIRSIPMSTIVMVVGVYSLICVAKEAGLVDAMSNILTNSLPTWLVPAFLVLFAAFLSFFSSCTSTVMPLMYPLVPTLAAATGLNPVCLFACIFIGGLSTAGSPFSTGGAITIAACADKDVKENVLPNQMILVSVIMPCIMAVLATVGLFSIFGV